MELLGGSSSALQWQGMLQGSTLQHTLACSSSCNYFIDVWCMLNLPA